MWRAAVTLGLLVVVTGVLLLVGPDDLRTQTLPEGLARAVIVGGAALVAVGLVGLAVG